MNKYDKIFIAIVLVCSVALYASFEWVSAMASAGQKIAIVSYRDKEVLRINMNTNNKYVVQGTLGPVEIEVENGKIRVEKENSPYHYCSLRGWVEKSLTPIVCLPNHVVIMIENTEVDPDGDDTVVY